MSAEPIVSVVMPCLNEEEALPAVIAKIRRTFESSGIDGEIVVCDNASTDRSAEVARALGARVVVEPRRGYGSAYLTAFAAARGRYLVMGDADDTYDFGLIPTFLQRLEKGDEFVTGSRYLEGGSRNITILHRLVGNPALTMLLNLLFGCRYTDVYCGLRAFSRKTYEKIRPVTLGMEFNLELAINARLAGLRVSEIPIELGPRKGVSKLRTFQDGWRSLRMMLIYCPNKVFLLPGLAALASGILLQMIALFGLVAYEGRHLGTTTAVVGAVASILGFKILSLGLHAKTYSWSRRFDPDNPTLARFYQYFTLEKGLVLGFAMMLVGASAIGWCVLDWIRRDLQPLSRPELVPVAATWLIIGTEMVFSSLFISGMSVSTRDPEQIQPSVANTDHGARTA
jgi:glycosyltransferase involved in cell wall biosynthesis